MSTSTKTSKKTRIKLKKPSMFRIIYMNDDVTTMEFVIESLMSIFNHSRSSAEGLTKMIHEQGSAIVAVLPFEMAEQKSIEVITISRANGFPLKIKIEED